MAEATNGAVADMADSTLPITGNSMYPAWQKTEFPALHLRTDAGE